MAGSVEPYGRLLQYWSCGPIRSWTIPSRGPAKKRLKKPVSGRNDKAILLVTCRAVNEESKQKEVLLSIVC